MSSQRNRTSKCNLTSLPKEIITAISLQLPDRKSIQNLARTSKAINSSCQPAVWHEIDLAVQPQLSYQAEQARKAEVKAKLRGIIMGANRRKWGMVQRVKLDTRFGMITGIEQLLENSQNLQELELLPRSRQLDHVPAHRQLRDADTLDIRWLSSELSLPFLTHLTLGRSSIRFAETVAVLCNAAPGLVSLVIDMTGDLSKAPALPCFPSVSGPTQIRQLRVSFPAEGLASHSVALQVALQLLRNSPQLRQLCLGGVGYTDFTLVGPVLIALSELQSLSMDVTTTGFWFLLHTCNVADIDNFPFLQKLVLGRDDWVSKFGFIAKLPALEALVFDDSPSPPLRLASPPPFPESPEPEDFEWSNLIVQLHRCPRLRMITTLRDHVDDGAFGVFPLIDSIDRNGTAEGFVRSLTRPGHQELFHGRFLLDYYEVSDGVDPLAQGDRVDSTDTEIRYQLDGEKRVKTMERRDRAVWREFTRYGLSVVPLEIINRMKKVEGAGARAWEGRNIEVGEAAWTVLTDWAYPPETDSEEEEEDVDGVESEDVDEGEGEEKEIEEMGLVGDAVGNKGRGPAERTRSKSRASGV